MRVGRCRARALVVAVIVAMAGLTAGCSGGDEKAKGGATTTAPVVPFDPSDSARQAFCDIPAGVGQSFSADANDRAALRAGLDAFARWVGQTAEGAPEQVRAELLYLVGRYQQVMAALDGGQPPQDALRRFSEDRERAAAAAATFSSYRSQRCGGPVVSAPV